MKPTLRLVKFKTENGLQRCPRCAQFLGKFAATYNGMAAVECGFCGNRFFTMLPGEAKSAVPFGVVSECKPDPDDPTKFTAQVTMTVPSIKWPRAIPVSEGYPPKGEVVMGFSSGWHDYKSTGKGFCFLPCDERPDARLPEITHWLPKPPDPRK